MSDRDTPTVPTLSVVVPVYNEAPVLAELVQRTVQVLDPLTESYELIVVDDGSDDDTPEILRALRQPYPALQVIRLVRNFGQNAALTCGLFAARGVFVVSMDGDLQNPPEEIPRLLDAFEPGVDLVSGLRAQRPEPVWRWLGSRAVHWLARLLVGGDLRDYGGQFKAYRREVVLATRQVWAPGKPFFALAVWLGFRVREVPVRHEPRRHGGTRYSVFSLVRLNLEILTSFTTAPLLALWGLPVVATAMAMLTTWIAWQQPASAWWLATGLAIAVAVTTAAVACVAVYVARLYRLAAGGHSGWVETPPRTSPPRFPKRNAPTPAPATPQ